jgi:transposase
MQATVTPQQRQAARRELLRQIEQGVSVREARVSSTVSMHRTPVYRLLKRVQSEGERALTDGRHGHPIKLHGAILALVHKHCQANPCVSSSAVHRLLQERFGVSVSVSQLNRVRAARGLTRTPAPREKKAPNELRGCPRLS